MLIKVFNDDEKVFEGLLKQFLEDNDNDEWLVNECKKLQLNNYIEFEEHSGHWKVEKI